MPGSENYVLGSCLGYQYLLLGEYDLSCGCDVSLAQYNANSGSYEIVWSVAPVPNKFAMMAEISRDCEMLAVGYTSYDYSKNTVVLYNPLKSKPHVWTYQFPNGTGGDNLMSSISMAPSGNTLSVGLWGDLKADVPQLYVFNTASNVPATMTYSGSVFSTTLFENRQNETYVIVGSKNDHATQWGNGVLSLVKYNN